MFRASILRAVPTLAKHAELPLEQFAQVARKASPVPFVNQLNFALHEETYMDLANELISRRNAVMDAVVAVPDNQRTFDNTLMPMSELFLQTQPLRSSVEFVKNVSVDKAKRDAAAEAEQALSKADVEARLRVDVFRAILSFSKTEEGAKLLAVNSDSDQELWERSRILKHALRDGRRLGLELPDDQRAQVKAVQQEISELELNFNRNVAEYDKKFHLTGDELKGVPATVLNGMNRDSDGKYEVTLSYPHVFPILEHCDVESTRKVLNLGLAVCVSLILACGSR